MAGANERLHDLDVAHQIGLQRYSAATVRKMLALLARTEADIVAQIEASSWDEVSRQSAKAARLDRMLEALKGLSKEAADALGKAMKAEMGELAGYEAEFQARATTSAVPSVSIGMLKTPTAEMLNAAVNARPFQGRVLKEWVQDLDAASGRRLRDAVRIGYVEGESIAEVVKRVLGTKALGYRDGVMEISRRGAEALVRTAITHTATASKEAFFRSNADVFRAVRWNSVLDGRTSAVCRGRDGQVFPIDSGPRPPAHIRCRSTMTAVLKGEADAPTGETYSGWLTRQDRDLQDEVLGVSKAQLWRRGGLELDRFVDRTGREYTLDELRRREMAAFTKAGLAA